MSKLRKGQKREMKMIKYKKKRIEILLDEVNG